MVHRDTDAARKHGGRGGASLRQAWAWWAAEEEVRRAETAMEELPEKHAKVAARAGEFDAARKHGGRGGASLRKAWAWWTPEEEVCRAEQA